MSQKDPLGGTFAFANTSLTVARMGYGAMQLTGPHVWGPPKDLDAAAAVLRETLALGINHIDTSDFYGPHITNVLIRRALAPYPQGLVIVTKVGFRRVRAGEAWPPAHSPAELTAAVHDNLQHLGLDALDIVNLRLPDRGAPGDVDAPLAALLELKQRGLIRHLGLSNITAQQFARAADRTEIVCVQNLYNLAQRGDDAFIDDLARRGVAYVPYFPLGGFTPLQSAALDGAARALGQTPMQVALAWLLQRSPNILLIPGTSSVEHLRENVAAAALRLPAEIVAQLDQIGASKP